MTQATPNEESVLEVLTMIGHGLDAVVLARSELGNAPAVARVYWMKCEATRVRGEQAIDLSLDGEQLSVSEAIAPYAELLCERRGLAHAASRTSRARAVRGWRARAPGVDDLAPAGSCSTPTPACRGLSRECSTRCGPTRPAQDSSHLGSVPSTLVGGAGR